jgi:MYXO-CTERM domain-containing protein
LISRAPFRVLVGVCLLVGAAEPSCTRSQPQFTLTRRPIINGQVDTTHESVVALVYTAHGTMQQFCSGTVIAPRWVLTAGHCYMETGFPPDQTKIFVGQTVGSGGQTIQIASAYVHPNYSLDKDNIPVNDICVVELTQDAPVAAMAWQRTPLATIIGQTVTLVGYGVTDAQMQTGNGTRRLVDEQVSDQDPMYLFYGGGTSGTCQGDSGGPMLAHDGTETIVGVTSAGDESCVQLGINTRVDPYADFIAQHVDNTAPQPVTVTITEPQNGSTEGPSITVSVIAESPAAVATVDLYLDDVLQRTLTTAPYNFLLTSVAAGSHTIRVVGTGTDGGSGEASITVTATGTPECSAEAPCATGYDCVSGACVVHTPAGGCSTESPCMSGFRCENTVCVVDAPPAPGTPGASCTQNADCHGGMCVDGATSHGYCTEQCATDDDCHNQAACLDMSGMGLCGPPNSAVPASLTNGGSELLGACRGAPGDSATPVTGALLVMLVLLGAGRLRRR